MRRSSLALRVITSSCAWWPEQHLGQAHGSVQVVLVLCKHRTLGGLAGTILLVLPPVHQVLSAATAVAAILHMQILAPFCFACGRHLERGFSAAKLLAAHSVCLWRYGPISLWRWIIFFIFVDV